MFGWLKLLFHTWGRKGRLARKTRDARPEVRLQAAVELGTVSEEWAYPELLRLLQDPHTVVREAAQAGLRQQGPRALPVLLSGLNHSDDQIAQQSADLLGELHHADAVQPLLKALKYNPRPVQLAARRALIRCGPLALDALREAEIEPQPWVRRQIEDILAEIGPKPDRVK
jgi:HEAT repeat protein